MIKYTFLSILLFTNLIAFAQTIYTGKLILKEKAIYNYKLVISIDSISNVVNGYSITDESGKEETKTLVRGTLQAAKKKIILEEYQIEKTKVKAKDISFCFVEAELTMSMAGSDSTLIGQFKGRLYPSRAICASGGLFVKQNKKAQKKKVKQTSDKTIVQGSHSINKTENIPVLDKMEIVKAGTKFQWSSDNILIEVWDQGNIDNDSISLFIDGKLYANKIQLSKEHIKYQIPFGKNTEHTISILAENEGLYSPNTAALLIIDDKRQHLLLCENKLHEMKSIKITR